MSLFNLGGNLAIRRVSIRILDHDVVRYEVSRNDTVIGIFAKRNAARLAAAALVPPKFRATNPGIVPIDAQGNAGEVTYMFRNILHARAGNARGYTFKLVKE